LPTFNVNAPFPPIVSLPVTFNVLFEVSDSDEPKIVPVELATAAGSQVTSFVMLRVPLDQLNSDVMPPVLIAPTFSVPLKRFKPVHGVL